MQPASIQPPPIRPVKRRSHAGFWITITLLSLALLASLVVILFMAGFSGGSPSAALGMRGGIDEYPELTERWSYGRGHTKVVRISYTGPIMRQAQSSGLFASRMNPVEDMHQKIRAATNDSDVRAILVEMDSPGGGVTPSDELYHALKTFKESRSDRTVLVFMRDLAASGGYYVSMAADWIIAEPTTILGSIGVIMSSINVEQLSQKVGVSDVTIKSGKNKDLLNPFQQPSEEQLALLQGMIDSMHQRFMQIVSDSRGIPMKELTEIADGRILDAQQARQLNLVDEIGYWDDAVTRMAELLNEESVRIVRYERATDLFTLLTQARTPIELPILSDYTSPRPQYLWRP